MVDLEVIVRHGAPRGGGTDKLKVLLLRRVLNIPTMGRRWTAAFGRSGKQFRMEVRLLLESALTSARLGGVSSSHRFTIRNIGAPRINQLRFQNDAPPILQCGVACVGWCAFSANEAAGFDITIASWNIAHRIVAAELS